jgi:hypothetical protein
MAKPAFCSLTAPVNPPRGEEYWAVSACYLHLLLAVSHVSWRPAQQEVIELDSTIKRVPRWRSKGLEMQPTYILRT